jgi:hypothetical protein
MTSYPIPREKTGKTLTAIRQLGRIQNCLRLSLQICLFNGITEPRHATLTSHLRRTHIAPIVLSVSFRPARFQGPVIRQDSSKVQRSRVQGWEEETSDHREAAPVEPLNF